MLRSKLIATAGASALAACLAAAAHAQTSVNTPPSEVEGVIVTGHQTGFVAADSVAASKTATPIIELPRSISVVTADEIRNRGADTLSQVFEYTSGINSDSYGGGSLSRSYTNVRGFLSYQYLDGLKLHDSNWAIEPFGLERAELIKGAASALYGQASPGGLIDLVSKRPTARPFGEVDLQVGSDNRFQGAVDFGGPLNKSGTLTGRFTALARDADTPVRFQKDNRIYIAPALTWRPSAKTELTLLGSYQSDPDQTVFQYVPRVGTITPSAFGFISRSTFDGEPNFDDLHVNRGQAALLFAHSFTDALTLRENVRVTNYDIRARYLQAGAVQANGRTVPRTAVNSDFTLNLIQTDTTLDWKLRTGPLTHQILAGIDYVYIPTSQGQGVGAGPILDLYAPVYGAAVTRPAIATKRSQDFDQTGVYLQDQIKFGMLSVLGGVRRDNATSDTSTLTVATKVRGANVHLDDDSTTGQVGAILNFANGLAPFVGYSSSFQPTAGTDFFGNPLVPTTGEQVELGVKYQPPGVRGLVTLSTYEITQNNVRTNDIAHPGFTIQTGQVRSRGVDLEGKLTLTDRLNVTAAYSYLDTVVTRTNTATQLGKTPAGRPRNQASAWADYRLGFIPGATVGLGVRFVGEAFGDAVDSFRVPSYTLVDMLVRYDLESLSPALHGLDVSVNALNLGDERYVANCDAATQCFYGQGRQVKATLRKRW